MGNKFLNYIPAAFTCWGQQCIVCFDCYHLSHRIKIKKAALFVCCWYSLFVIITIITLLVLLHCINMNVNVHQNNGLDEGDLLRRTIVEFFLSLVRNVCFLVTTGKFMWVKIIQLSLQCIYNLLTVYHL